MDNTVNRFVSSIEEFERTHMDDVKNTVIRDGIVQPFFTTCMKSANYGGFLKVGRIPIPVDFITDMKKGALVAFMIDCALSGLRAQGIETLAICFTAVVQLGMIPTTKGGLPNGEMVVHKALIFHFDFGDKETAHFYKLTRKGMFVDSTSKISDAIELELITPPSDLITSGGPMAGILKRFNEKLKQEKANNN